MSSLLTLPTANRSTESFGDFVRRTRKYQNLSLADVSKQSADFGKPISASYINRIENNRQRPTPDRLAALANGLGVPVQELLARAIGVTPSGESSDELHLLTRFRELSAERQTDVLNIVDMWYSQGLNNG